MESDQRLTLELVGGFPVDVESPDAFGSPIARTVDAFPVVYGRCDDRAFTLLNVLVAQTFGSRHRPDRQKLSPQRSLVGEVFIDGADHTVIIGVLLELDYLLFFTQLNGHSHLEAEGDQALVSTAYLTRQDRLTARWKDMQFTAGLAWSGFTTRQDNPNSQTLETTQRAQLLIEFDEPKPLSEVDRLAGRLQDLVTVAMHRPCAARATIYQLRRPAATNEYERERAELDPMTRLKGYGRKVYAADTDPYRDPRRGDVLLTVTSIPFADLVPRWLDLYDRATVGLQMFAGSRYMDTGFVATRLSTICATLEAIHSALYDHPKMEQTEFDSFVEQALSGVLDEKHRDILSAVLQRNRLSYRARARELVRKLPADVTETLIGRTDKWVHMIAKSRNDLAHANLSDQGGSKQVFLLLITQVILAMIIGKELGLTDDAIREFAQSQWSLTDRWKQVTGQVAD